jgi:hypothetical protein
MLIYAIALFALAALIGLYLLSRVFGNALPPLGAVAFHGLFAASGLLLLLYVAFVEGAPQPQAVMIAAVLLVVAALGGFLMLSLHLRKRVPPKGLAGLHALLAVAGVGTLAASVFSFI